MRLVFFLFFCIFFSLEVLLGQKSDLENEKSGWLHVDSVRLTGLRKTRPAYVLRELDFEKGDSIETIFLLQRLDENRQRLMNTGLFSEAKFDLKKSTETGHVLVEIALKEAFFLEPYPILELADRNFNVWWTDHDRSLRYLNFGFWLAHSNISGRGDRLKMSATLGYLNRYDVGYLRPAFNQKKTLGFEILGIWQRNREVGFRSSGNRLQLFFDPERRIFWRKEARAALIWRPKLRWTHRFESVFFQNRVADTLARDLNPNFFLNKKTRQTVAGLLATTQFEGRDNRFYPLKGSFLSLEARKMGRPKADMNTFSTTAEVGKWLLFSKKWGLEAIAKGKKAWLRDSIPYYNFAAIGYRNDYLRGYEYYVVDGASWAFVKLSVRRELLNRVLKNDPDLVPISAFLEIPIRVYASLNGDFGFVDDPFYGAGNPFSNRVLRGGGFGLDVVLLGNKAFQLEVSANHLGEIGFFFHYKSGL